MLLELEEDVEGMQNTILLMQRELKVEKERNQSVERDNGRMMAVLKDKPEWLAVVQAEAALAAAERVKEEQEQQQENNNRTSVCVEDRVNGGSALMVDVGGNSDDLVAADDEKVEQMEVGDSTSAKTKEDAQVRTRSAGEVKVLLVDCMKSPAGLSPSSLSPASLAALNHPTGDLAGGDLVANGKESGGASVAVAAPRKRTRSSVANSGLQVVTSAESDLVVVDPPVVVTEANCVGKRTRRSSSTSSDHNVKCTPRTRGQLLQITEQEEKRMDVENGEKVVVVMSNGAGGGGENGAGGRRLGGLEGAVEAMKLKLENGAAAAAAAGIDLRQENTKV